MCDLGSLDLLHVGAKSLIGRSLDRFAFWRVGFLLRQQDMVFEFDGSRRAVI